MDKNEQKMREIAKQVFNEELLKTQFGFNSIPFHVHNQTDSPRIPPTSVINFVALPSKNTSNDPDGVPSSYSGVASVDNVSPFVSVNPPIVYPTSVVEGFGNGGGSPDYSVFHGGNATTGTVVPFYRASSASTTAEFWVCMTSSFVSEFNFTAVVAMGATSATLAVAWAYQTGAYKVTFSNGDVRDVTLTINATTATWTGGLSSGATAVFNAEVYAQWWGVELPLNPTI